MIGGGYFQFWEYPFFYAQGAMHTSAEWKEAAELPAPGAASRRRSIFPTRLHTGAEWKEAAELPAPGAASRRRNHSQLYEAGWHHEAFVPDRIGKISGQGFFYVQSKALAVYR